MTVPPPRARYRWRCPHPRQGQNSPPPSRAWLRSARLPCAQALALGDREIELGAGRRGGDATSPRRWSPRRSGWSWARSPGGAFPSGGVSSARQGVASGMNSGPLRGWAAAEVERPSIRASTTSSHARAHRIPWALPCPCWGFGTGGAPTPVAHRGNVSRSRAPHRTPRHEALRPLEVARLSRSACGSQHPLVPQQVALCSSCIYASVSLSDPPLVVGTRPCSTVLAFLFITLAYSVLATTHRSE